MQRDSNTTTSALSGAIMLIGLAVLLLVEAIPFWPWILVVVALASLPAGVQRAGLWGIFPPLWLIALAIFAAAGWFVPGLLILIAVGVVVSMVNRSRR